VKIKLETKTLLQTEKSEDGVFVRAIKQKEARHESLVLVKRKPAAETYVSILRAIKFGANHPSMIVQSTRVSWITVMQCVRTLEQKGLIETGYDSKAERVVSKLTESGNKILDENN
jgi:predicted transcriptional regulator